MQFTHFRAVVLEPGPGLRRCHRQVLVLIRPLWPQELVAERK